MGWMTWVRFLEEKGGFLFLIEWRPALAPTQSPIQWVLGAVSPGVKQWGHEAHHSPPSSAEIKNGGVCTSIPPYASMAQCLRIKYTGNFTFTLHVSCELLKREGNWMWWHQKHKILFQICNWKQERQVDRHTERKDNDRVTYTVAQTGKGSEVVYYT
jgi:hypothetical protein